jgi:hypothetical protein
MPNSGAKSLMTHFRHNKQRKHIGLIISVIIIIIIIIIYQAVRCFHIFLRPFSHYAIFLPQLFLSVQSSSCNPFSPWTGA